MNTIKVMLVEDGAEDLQSYHSTIKGYQREKGRTVETIEAKTTAEALGKIDNTFDGAIIDLKLAGDVDAGNTVIEGMQNKCRIPVAVLTARPGDLRENAIIKAYKKGESGSGYDEILDDLFSICDTGITKIVGGRGEIEQAMNKIFWRNILPKFDVWKAYRASGATTEGALLRFIIAHLYEVIDNDISNYFPEEMYIHPPIKSNLVTGSIVKQKDAADYFIVLSPACDLALHEGRPKTDRILLCVIEKSNNSVVKGAIKNLTHTDLEKQKKAEDILARIPCNAHCGYYHYLPKVDYFAGGIINFRKVCAHTLVEIEAKFEKPEIQIAAPFIKDVVSRFSSYYARQGQPDFDFERLTASLIATGQ